MISMLGRAPSGFRWSVLFVYFVSFMFPQFPLPTYLTGSFWGQDIAQSVKHLPSVRETWVQSLSREDSLEKEMATHSSTLAWRIPWTEEPSGLRFVGWQELDTTWCCLSFYESKWNTILIWSFIIIKDKMSDASDIHSFSMYLWRTRTLTFYGEVPPAQIWFWWKMKRVGLSVP